MNTSLNKKQDILSISESIVKSCSNGATVIVPHISDNMRNFAGDFNKKIQDRYPIVKLNYDLLHNSSLGNTRITNVFNGCNDQKMFIATMIAQDRRVSKNRNIHYPSLIRCLYIIKSHIQSIQELSGFTNVQLHVGQRALFSNKLEMQFIAHIFDDVFPATNKYYY